jgi:hypothetical protein
MKQINEKAKSKQQMKFIYAMRNKFKSAKEAPKKMKWVFDEDWTKGVKFKKLPSKVSESGVLNFETWVLYKESMNNKCDCTNCDCQGICEDCECSCCFNESKIGLIEGEKFCRKCNECGGGMCEGYVVNGGEEYYCDDECLYKNYTPEDWKEMSSDEDEDQMGSSDNYWTQWDSDDDSELEYIVKNGELVEIDSIKENNDYKQIDNNRCDCDICECNQPLMEENEIDICNDCRVNCYNL